MERLLGQMQQVGWNYGGTGAGISAGVAAAGTFLTALLGGWDAALGLLCLAMAIDFFAGIAAACKNQAVDSKVMFWGGVNKLFVLLLVALANALDGALPLSEPYIRTALIWFYIGREGLSILENYGKLGGGMPDFLKALLVQITEQAGKGTHGSTGKRD